MDSLDSKCGYLVVSVGVLSWAETMYYRSTQNGVTLNHLSKFSATRDSFFCECLLSGNKFRPQVYVIITSLQENKKAYRN